MVSVLVEGFMVLVPVDSTAVYAFGYDDEQHTLDVVFYRSGVYRYFDVPRDIFDNWLTAESKGRYLRQAVIGNFSYERLRPRRRSMATEESEAEEEVVLGDQAEQPSSNGHDDNRPVEENAAP
jgi:KTSC domain